VHPPAPFPDNSITIVAVVIVWDCLVHVTVLGSTKKICIDEDGLQRVHRQPSEVAKIRPAVFVEPVKSVNLVE